MSLSFYKKDKYEVNVNIKPFKLNNDSFVSERSLLNDNYSTNCYNLHSNISFDDIKQTITIENLELRKMGYRPTYFEHRNSIF